MNHQHTPQRRARFTPATVPLAIVLLIVLLPVTATAQWRTLPKFEGELYFAQHAMVGEVLYSFGGASDVDTTVGRPVRMLDTRSGGTWEVVGAMPSARWGGYAAAIAGKIYIVGGIHRVDGVTRVNTSVLEFDPVSMTFTEKTPMPDGVFFGAGAVIDNRIYIVGGMAPSSAYSTVTRVYDPATDRWSTATPPPYVGRFVSGVGIDKDIYMIGGVSDKPTAEAYRGRVDGATIRWTRIADYPTAVIGGAAGALGGVLYVAGGFSDDKATDAVYRFDTVTNVWKRDYPLPAPSYFNAVMPSDDSSLYYIGGVVLPDVFAFTPGAPAPVAVVRDPRIVMTVAAGESVSTAIDIVNKGLVDLSVSATIPDDAKGWLSVSTPTAPMKPDTGGVILLTVNAASLTAGMRTVPIEVLSNDPHRGVIPVTLVVFVQDDPVRAPMVAVVEGVTGAWCDRCHQAEEEFKRLQDVHGANAHVIVYHANRGDGGTAVDPLYFPAVLDLAVGLGMSVFPSASFNRTVFPGESTPMVLSNVWSSYLTTLLQSRSYAPTVLTIGERSYDPATSTITAEVNLTISDAILMREGMSLNISGVVTQDGIVSRQASLFGPITSYTFNRVVRGIGPTVFGAQVAIDPSVLVEGDVIPPGTTLTGTISVNVDPSTNQGTEDGLRFPFDPSRSNLIAFAHLQFGSVMGPILGTDKVALSASSGVADRAPADAGSRSLVSLEGSNPVTSTARLRLVLPEPDRVRIEVVNLAGRTVLTHEPAAFEAGVNHLDLDVSSLMSGVYIVMMTGEAGTASALLHVVH